MELTILVEDLEHGVSGTGISGRGTDQPNPIHGAGYDERASQPLPVLEIRAGGCCEAPYTDKVDAKVVRVQQGGKGLKCLL